MNIVYYSHTNNTSRFVENHLAPQINLNPMRFAGDTERWLIEGVNVTRIVASGPKAEANNHLPPLQPGKSVVVFPIYARLNYEDATLIDTVPKCIRDFIKENRSEVVAAVATGNRTFGNKFGHVNSDELFGVPLAGVAELSGTKREAVEIVSALSDLARESHINKFYKEA